MQNINDLVKKATFEIKLKNLKFDASFGDLIKTLAGFYGSALCKFLCKIKFHTVYTQRCSNNRLDPSNWDSHLHTISTRIFLHAKYLFYANIVSCYKVDIRLLQLPRLPYGAPRTSTWRKGAQYRWRVRWTSIRRHPPAPRSCGNLFIPNVLHIGEMQCFKLKCTFQLLF